MLTLWRGLSLYVSWVSQYLLNSRLQFHAFFIYNNYLGLVVSKIVFTMKKFKHLLALSLFLLLTNTSKAQLKIKWEDVNVINDQTIIVEVFAQNYGRGYEFFNTYGYNGNKDLANIFIEYDLLRENRRIKLLPSSITIKTIFDSSIEMSTPTYYFGSTGSESGEKWEIIYNLPYESANIILTTLGSKKIIEDFQQGKELKKKLKVEFLEKRNSTTFNYQDLNKRHFQTIQNKIIDLIHEFTLDKKSYNYSGSISFTVSKEGITTFDSDVNNRNLNEYLTDKLSTYKLYESKKHGYRVVASAVYNIYAAKGKSNIRCNKKRQIVSIKPEINDKKLLDRISQRIYTKGLHKVKYSYISVNNEEHHENEINAKHISLKVPAVLLLLAIGVVTSS